MMFGKKQRYIEVFQCSGEDMNMVLNGGGYQYPSPPAISAKPLGSSSGMLPSRPQQQAQPLQISIPPPLTLSLPQSAVLQNATSTNASAVAGGNQSAASSLIAQQQQAHYIAQQSLMARQHAAAAAAQLQAAQQQQSDQMAFFQNFSFLQSPAGAGVSQGMPGNPYPFQLSPQMPQFYFLPRPTMLPMGLMPSNALGQMQYPGMQSAAGYSPSAIQAIQNSAQMSGAAGSVQQASSQLATSSGKRSYESAFRNDQMNMSAAKRAFHPNPGAGNIYGTYPYPQL